MFRVYDHKVYVLKNVKCPSTLIEPFYTTKFSLTSLMCQMFFDRVNSELFEQMYFSKTICHIELLKKIWLCKRLKKHKRIFNIYCFLKYFIFMELPQKNIILLQCKRSELICNSLFLVTLAANKSSKMNFFNIY